VIKTGRPFFKMSGSGNDFVFVDARSEPPGNLEKVETIQAVCARGSGVGADGIVFLSTDDAAEIRIRYLNSDGSLAALCGNATLCATRLAAELGIVGRDQDFTVATDSGPVTARFREGRPEIDLQPVTELLECFDSELARGERRIGFALVGVPHLVVSCEDVGHAPVADRGRQLRRHERLAHGANVNFVSRDHADRWRIRTYERGVEAETLACGTGAVASALMLAAWGEAADRCELETKSGRVLRVRHRRDAGKLFPSLSGEARIVYRGELAELFSTTV
jgi:diaminopimelate epimerase